MKFRPHSSPDYIGLIEDITFENIHMDEPEQYVASSIACGHGSNLTKFP